QDRQRVRADLVGRVPVRGHTVCADDDRVDLALCHQRTRGPIDDDGMGDARTSELPGGQPCALQVRSAFVDPHVYRPAVRVETLDDAEGGAHLAGGERAGIAVG